MTSRDAATSGGLARLPLEPRIERGLEARDARSAGGSDPLPGDCRVGGGLRRLDTQPEPESQPQRGDELRRVRDGVLLGVGDAVPRRRQPGHGGLDRRRPPAPGGGRGPRRRDGGGAPGTDQHRARGRTRADRLCRRLAARGPADGRDGPLLRRHGDLDHRLRRRREGRTRTRPIRRRHSRQPVGWSPGRPCSRPTPT